MLASPPQRLPHGQSSHQRPFEQHHHRFKEAALLHSGRIANVSASNLTGRHHSGRARGYAGPYQAVPLTSPPWQGIVSKHLKNMQPKRLVHFKVSGSFPSLASDDGPQDLGNDRGRQTTRVEAAQVDASTISVDVWSEERHAEKLVSIDGSEQYCVSENGAAFSDISRLHNEKCLFEANGSKEVLGNKALRSFEAEKQLRDTPATSGLAVEELEDTPLSSLTGAEMRLADATQASGSSLKNSSEGSQAAKNHIELLEHTASTQISANSKTLVMKQTMGFWQILENDVKFITDVLNWIKEDALPSLVENVEKVVTMRLGEDPSAAQALETQSSRPYYPGFSGLELLAADAMAVKGYFHIALGWLMAWRIPLEPCYDPHKIAAYFNRRPHVLLFRILQVSVVFGSAITQLEIENFLRPAKLNPDNEVYARRRGAELIKEALIKLGPTFIKVGQSLSTRPDLVGADASKILAELQDNLPPFPTREAVSTIEEELGQPLSAVFPYLSEMPVAAASFGQVYKGRTTDGQDVAVKVQRPNLLHLIALDIYILRMGLAALREIAKRRSDLKLYADELGQGLFGELDYTCEAANAAEFQEAHSKLSFLEVPKTIRSLSTKRVLTMEWINGDRPAEMLLIAKLPNPDGDLYLRERQLKAKQRLFSLVNKGIEASLVQLLDTGVLHADPHPGNLLYTEKGKMVFLDFGLLCRMEKHHQLAMLASVAHIVNADWKNFVQDLADMEVLPAYINHRLIAMELEEALGDAVPQEGIPDIKFSKVLVKVLAIALKHHFKMPPYFILVLRSIASLEGLALAVDPDFKVFAASYPFVLQKLLTENSAPLRRVLISLVLNDKKQFRWDRLASFATLARQHTLKRVALETGMELQPVNVPDYDVKNTNPELIPLLVNLVLSENGAVFRQLILEADTFDLARAFNSSKAAALRRNAAIAMANVFSQCGKTFLKEHVNIELQDLVKPKRTSLSPSPAEWTQQASLISEKALTDDVKSLINCSDTVDVSLLKSTQMQFLLQAIVARLKRRPLLMLNTGWTGFTMLCYAIALAAHRLVVAVCFKLFETSSESSPRSGHEFITA